MESLLQRREQERLQRREALRLEVRTRLRTALGEIAPGMAVTVFGSLTRPGDFHEASDIDVALPSEPASCSLFQLQARLEEQMGRPVDVVLLPESRLRTKIEREGEVWTS